MQKQLQNQKKSDFNKKPASRCNCGMCPPNIGKFNLEPQTPGQSVLYNLQVQKSPRVHPMPSKGISLHLKMSGPAGHPQAFPIRAYRPTGTAPGQYTFLVSSDFCSVMQLACHLAYLDKCHYLCKNIHLLQSHSNHITAVVVVYNAGMSIEVIFFSPLVEHRV